MSASMSDFGAANHSLEEIVMNERPATRREIHKAETERHLRKVADKTADLRFNTRLLFFPVLLAVVFALGFAALETPTYNEDGTVVKRVSKRARRRLAEMEEEESKRKAAEASASASIKSEM